MNDYNSTPAGRAKRRAYNRSPKRRAFDTARNASPAWKLYLRKRKLAGYGLTPEAYDAILTRQGGVCAIAGCGRAPNGKALHVDHDHSCCPGRTSCGKCVRGLLCAGHNAALGLLGDNEAGVASALDYLKRKYA
jgi:hypothetical protein